jgi:hypothetical protein
LSLWDDADTVVLFAKEGRVEALEIAGHGGKECGLHLAPFDGNDARLNDIRLPREQSGHRDDEELSANARVLPCGKRSAPRDFVRLPRYGRLCI